MTELPSSDNSSFSSSSSNNGSTTKRKDVKTNINSHKKQEEEDIAENISSPLMKSHPSIENITQQGAATTAAAATKSTPPKTSKSTKQSKQKIEEDYGLPSSSTSSSLEEANNLTTTTNNNNDDTYTSFPPRTPHLPTEEEYDNDHSCCSHLFIITSGLFVLIHFVCCVVAWIIPWWDALVRLEVLKKKDGGGDDGWVDWQEGSLTVLKDGSFSVILQNVKSSGSLLVLLLIILSAIILPTFCILAHSILVFIIYHLTSIQNTILGNSNNNNDDDAIKNEEQHHVDVEEMERNTLLLEEERLVAPFTNAPTDHNTLMEPLLTPRPASTTAENSIEIEELSPSSSTTTTTTSKCARIQNCLGTIFSCCTSCKCPSSILLQQNTSLYKIDMTLLFFEILYKFACCLIYVETIVFIATGGVVLFLNGENDTDDDKKENQPLSIRASLVNKARGGYIAYFLGINVGILATILLRAHLNHEYLDYKVEKEEEDNGGEAGATSQWTSFGMVKGENETFYFDDTEQNDAGMHNDDDESGSVSDGNSRASGSVKTPPISAFRISQHSTRKGDGKKRRSSRWNQRKKKAARQQQRSTLEFMSLSSTTGALLVQEEITNQQQSTSSSFLNPESGSVTPSNQNNNNKNLNLKEQLYTRTFWRSLLLFESGLFASLFLLPTYSLPILRLNYDGLASTLMPATSRDLTIWDIAILVWDSPTNANYFVRVWTTGFFWVNVIFCPVLSLVCALVLRGGMAERLSWCWRKITCTSTKSSSNNRNRSASLSCRNEIGWYRALQYTYPLAATSPFALCILVAALAMTDISLQIFDQDAFCRSANLARDCLLIEGKLLTGSWFCFLQAVFFDIFVCMTLADLK